MKLLALSALLLSYTSCIRNPKLSNEYIISGLDVLSVQANWNRAMNIGRQWDQDAYVSNIKVDIPLPNGNRGVSQSLVFDFQTKTNDLAGLMVACNEHRCKKILIQRDKGSPVIHADPIMIKDVTVDSKEVLRLSLEHGGRNFVYRENSTLVLFLNRRLSEYKGTLVWRVSYSDYTNGNDLDVYIDANTKEVLKVSEKSIYK